MAALARLKSIARLGAKIAASEALFPAPLPRWTEATAQVTWHAKDARRRDKDNCLASLKSAFDGFVDAGLLADDSGLTHLPMTITKDAANPRVEITITNTAPL